MSTFEKGIINNHPCLKEIDRFPVLDNHMHLNPGGSMEKMLGDFYRAGGTHVVLVHKPYREAPISRATDFRKSFNITLRLAGQIEEKTEVKALNVIGPYPVNIIYLQEKYGLEKAVDIMKKGMEFAGELVEEGLSQGIGEIGRPHFPVNEDIINASNEILELGLTIAAENKCPVHLHTESGGETLFQELAHMAKKCRCPAERILKHFSGPMVLEEENHGLFPSVLASSKNITRALKKGTRLVMETDYMDDPERPGAVMVPKTIPRRTFDMIDAGLLDQKGAFAIHSKWPEKIYGTEFQV